jgi:Flp pilus assembly protein TadG
MQHPWGGRRGRQDNEYGANAVEFAIVLPVLLLVVFGIISFGIIFAQELALGNAARQGARYGVVADVTCDEIKAEAVANAESLAMPSSSEVVEVTVTRGGAPCTGATVACAGSDPDDNVEVEARFNSVPLVPLIFTSGVELTGTGTFRCEFS